MQLQEEVCLSLSLYLYLYLSLSMRAKAAAVEAFKGLMNGTSSPSAEIIAKISDERVSLSSLYRVFPRTETVCLL